MNEFALFIYSTRAEDRERLICTIISGIGKNISDIKTEHFRGKGLKMIFQNT